MKTLPKFYAIMRDAKNPLWKDYIAWWNKTYDQSFSGDSNAYYGFDGKADYWHDLINFDEPVEVITLEQWNECVNGIPMKKTIKQWLEELPQGYRERALKNFKGRNSSNIYPTMDSALLAAFIWLDTEEKLEFWKAVCNHYFKGMPLPELPKDEQTGKLIGYRFVKEQCLKAAIVIMTNYHKDGTGDEFCFNIDMDSRGYPNSLPLDCRAVRYLREAGVLDLWFEPIYVKPEIVHSVGGKFNVTIKDGDIYHCDTIITDYVKAIKEFTGNVPTQLHGFTFSIKDIIFNQTGCEIKETSIRDWLNLYQVWKDNS